MSEFHTRITQIEPDWLLICFTGEKPPLDRRAFFLHRTLSEWLNDHPGRIVSSTVSVHHQGAVVGMNVWLEPPGIEEACAPAAPAADHQALPNAGIAPPRLLGDPQAERKFAVKIDADLANSIHQEHLEALLQHAYEIFFEDDSRAPVLAVISKAGLAVVLDRSTEQGHALRVERLGLKGEASDEFRHWQATAKSNYFVLPMTAFPPLID